MNDFNKRGKFLLSLRLKYNLKQKELASIINYSDKAISKWERGECFPHDPNVIINLANLFNVSIEEILNGEYNDNNVEKKAKTSFNYIFLWTKCILFKYKYLIFLILVICVIFGIFYFISFNDFGKSSKYSFTEIKENNDENFEDYDFFNKKRNLPELKYSKLINMGFIEDNFIYYKNLSDNVIVRYYYDLNVFKIFYYIDEDNFYVITDSFDSEYTIVEIFTGEKYNDFYLTINEIKNCEIEKCDNYNDYAMYINYLKKLINE